MTPIQCRMARAALKITLRKLGALVGVSGVAIQRFEAGDETVIGEAMKAKLQILFFTRGVYFGPADGICIGQDVFKQERWIVSALFQLLSEAGITPSSQDLIAAQKAARSRRRVRVQ